MHDTLTRLLVHIWGIWRYRASALLVAWLRERGPVSRDAFRKLYVTPERKPGEALADDGQPDEALAYNFQLPGTTSSLHVVTTRVRNPIGPVSAWPSEPSRRPVINGAPISIPRL